jgi:signal transduction histidine kinase
MQLSAPDQEPKVPDILVVDDTLANLQLLAGMLKDRGYRVRPVPSGKLALQAIQKEPPELILLDINMPEMNGYEVCTFLKADVTLREIPVLFISALDETIDKVKAFAAGGVDYITKPFQFEEVEARVKTHLKLRRLQLELERQNRQLRESYGKLKKLEDLRDNLTHMVVHDMRSPLMGITAQLEILEMDAEKTFSPEDLESLRNARSSGVVLVGMVTSLLDISRLEQCQMPLDVTCLDIDVLIQNALKSLGALTKQVSLLYHKKDLPVMATCDANLITRVIANLVGNAIKFAPEGSEVAISAENAGEVSKLCVADAGNGIPHEYHEKIFEKFGQVETRQQRKLYSTGLGLTFCKLAVEANGGKIGVESEVGRGSTFWFTLPLVSNGQAESPK